MVVWRKKRCCELPNAGESNSGFDGRSRDVIVENFSRHIQHELNKRTETKAAI